jgi:hypothetical protein
MFQGNADGASEFADYRRGSAVVQMANISDPE